MDGPTVNIKFLNEFKLKQEENAFHSISDIGTCSLHTVHGSVKTAFDKFNMKKTKLKKHSGSKNHPWYYCVTC